MWPKRMVLIEHAIYIWSKYMITKFIQSKGSQREVSVVLGKDQTPHTPVSCYVNTGMTANWRVQAT